MAPHLPVRRGVPGDAEAIERIRVDGWKTAYRGILSDAFLDALTGNPTRCRERLATADAGEVCLVAEIGRDVVGFVIAGDPRDEDLDAAEIAEIWAIYAEPARKRQGVGRALMTAALAEVGDRGIALWVLCDNHASRAFYAACGFRPDGAQKALDRRRGPALTDDGSDVIEVRYRLRPGRSSVTSSAPDGAS